MTSAPIRATWCASAPTGCTSPTSIPDCSSPKASKSTTRYPCAGDSDELARRRLTLVLVVRPPVPGLRLECAALLTRLPAKVSACLSHAAGQHAMTSRFLLVATEPDLDRSRQE